jgi:hypothetical protein
LGLSVVNDFENTFGVFHLKFFIELLSLLWVINNNLIKNKLPQNFFIKGKLFKLVIEIVDWRTFNQSTILAWTV